MHLNKSTYIKGESIGFTAYVLNKKDKKPSLLTTNLYVSVSDKNQKVVKEKLISVANGVASNIIELDSLFTSGYYSIKAYTNWMLNFNEQNYYTESIRIIDPETEQFVEEKRIENQIDAQFLPESGHLLNGVVNTIGVVIKDNLGFGIPNAKGEIIDKNNEVLTSFETNQFGIGKVQLLADISNTYNVRIKNANKEFTFNLNQNVEKNGIIMSLNILKSKVFVSIVTNPETLEQIRNKRHTLLIHNGDNYDIMDIYFTDQTVVTKSIDYTNTASGVNILTLFNEDDQPIAERLFFNYDGIKIQSSDGVSAIKAKDSLTLNLNFKRIDSTAFNSLSISVLPQETQSYNRHNNMLSYVFLQPYIKGSVEQAKYYFTDIDAKKQYELDNLLLTQGWSSYNWNTIFNDELNDNYAFEQGITLKANINMEKNLKDTYILHQLYDQQPRYIKAADGEDSFTIPNIYPMGDETIYLSRLINNKDLEPAQLYIQSFPNRIPRLNFNSVSLNPKPQYKTNTNFIRNDITFPNDADVQKLDEVVLTSQIDKNRIRTRKLSEHSHGYVKVVSDTDRLSYLTLGDYLRYQKNLDVVDEPGVFKVFARGGVNTAFIGPTGAGMLIYFDDIPLQNADFLSRYSLDNIDYVEINRNGLGYGVLGGRGVIKIYSKFDPIVKNRPNNTVQKVKLPLVFSEKKKFYVPKYSNHNDDFFKAYGTIEWKPELITDKDGNVSIKIAQPEVPITLFIEGIANDGDFIFEEKTISLN
jgi:hypothetical protein